MLDADPAIALAFRLALGVTFVAASLGKIRRPRVFAVHVANYEVLPRRFAHLGGVLLISIELALGISLLTGYFVRVADALLICVLLLFIAAVGVNLRRGRRVPCGCFGDGDELISPRTVARLVLLLSAAVLLAALSDPGPTLEVATDQRGSDGAARLIEASSLAAGGSLIALWLLHLPELLEVARRAREIMTRAGEGQLP